MNSPRPGGAFAPTQEMINAAKNVFINMAFFDLVKPIVKNYTELVLAERDWPINPRFAPHYPMTLIKEYKDIHLIDTEYWKSFYTRVNEVRLQTGVYVKEEDLCPLSVANSQLFMAECELLTAMSTVTRMTSDQVNLKLPSQRKKVIDLTLKLLAPFIGKPLLPDDVHTWCIGEEAKTMEDARTLVSLATNDLNLSVGAWEKAEPSDIQWEYATLKIDEQHGLSIGISENGVVTVDGDPYTIKHRLLNKKLAYVHDSIQQRVKTISANSLKTVEASCNN